ncbi:MAG: nitrite reductase small subunit NirD [Marinobacter sp.]|uniref:nitrite reductase small subunit NirD n=1 Tax=Marinobacter sp. TaxID=50741 RepID=UPI0034A020CF
MKPRTQWHIVCNISDLVPDSGIAVWTSTGPVALFYLPDRLPALFAIGHFDPCSGADVLARGITGDIKGEPVVASPIYKQHFSLLTGQCLEDDSIRVPVFCALVDGDQVRLEIPVSSQGQQAA